MTKRTRSYGGRRGEKRSGLYFILAMMGALLLDLPGFWLFPAAALSVAFLLLFLHSARGGCLKAPASRAALPSPDLDFSLSKAHIPQGSMHKGL